MVSDKTALRGQYRGHHPPLSLHEKVIKMDSIETDLRNLENLFRLADKHSALPRNALARLLYIPVEKRMRILRELLLPLARKGS